MKPLEAVEFLMTLDDKTAKIADTALDFMTSLVTDETVFSLLWKAVDDELIDLNQFSLFTEYITAVLPIPPHGDPRKWVAFAEEIPTWTKLVTQTVARFYFLGSWDKYKDERFEEVLSGVASGKMLDPEFFYLELLDKMMQMLGNGYKVITSKVFLDKDGIAVFDLNGCSIQNPDGTIEPIKYRLEEILGRERSSDLWS